MHTKVASSVNKMRSPFHSLLCCLKVSTGNFDSTDGPHYWSTRKFESCGLAVLYVCLSQKSEESSWNPHDF